MALDHQTQFIEVQDLPRGDLGEADAAVRADQNQPFRTQPLQGGADRAETEFEPRRQRALGILPSGLFIQEIGPDPGMGFIFQQKPGPTCGHPVLLPF